MKRVPGFWPALLVAATVLYLTLSRTGADVVFLLASLCPVGAVLVGLRRYRPDPGPRYLLLGGLVLAAVPNVAWLVAHLGDRTAIGGWPYLLAALGHLGILAASAMVVIRRTPTDRGGLVQAALIGIGLSGPVWELLIRPRLLTGEASPAMQTTDLVVVMALMTVLGTQLRAASTTVLARAALGYLFVAVSSGLVAVVVSIATSNAAMDSHPRWVNPIWFVSYFAVAAAMLHPSVAYLTTPERVPQDDLSPRTLVGTGLVLTINPLISAVTEFVGPKPDALLLAVGVLLSTPLVLVRFWYLGQQRLRAEQRYAHWAAHDELTGLPNRRQLLAELDRALAQRTRLTVLFCDLDGFKPVNDRLGHQAGDELLTVVGQRLRRCVRARDVVGRFGGDEFMIVCVDLPPSGTDEVVARIRATLAEPVALAGGTAVVGASIGVAVTEPGREYTADSLIAEADRAMYAQKHRRVTGSPGRSGGSGRSAVPAGRR